MKKNEKIMIVVLIAIAIAAIVFAVNFNKSKEEEAPQASEPTNVVKEEFVEVLEDGTRLNTSEKLAETKTFDGMQITDLQLTENGNVSLLLGTVTNTSDTTKGGYPVNIKVLDKKGEEIITVAAFLGELEPGESTQLSTSATFDYANAYDFEITKK